MFAPWKKSYGKPRPHIKKQRHTLLTKVLYSQSYGFSSSQVWIWELDNKKGWVPKNWCLWTVGLEKILESPSDSKEIKSINPKGNQYWIFFGRTDAEAEAPTLMPLDAKSQLIRKDRDAGKSITDLKDMSLSRQWRTGKPGMLQSTGSQIVGHDWVTEQQQI